MSDQQSKDTNRPSTRILVIDDIREFEGATHAKTSEEGLRLIQSQEWDEIWLDHDLGGDDTTRPVVCWLEENYGRLEVGDPIIHAITVNPVGMEYIVAALRGKYHVYKSPGGAGLGLRMERNV